MKLTRKSLLALLLCAAMLFCTIACNADDTDKTPPRLTKIDAAILIMRGISLCLPKARDFEIIAAIPVGNPDVARESRKI